MKTRNWLPGNIYCHSILDLKNFQNLRNINFSLTLEEILIIQ